MQVYHASRFKFDRFDPAKSSGDENGELFQKGVNFSPCREVAEYYQSRGSDYLYECELHDDVPLLYWSEKGVDSVVSPAELVKAWYGLDVIELVVDVMQGSSDGGLWLDRGELGEVAIQLLLGDVDQIAAEKLDRYDIDFDFDDWKDEHFSGVPSLDISTEDEYGRMVLQEVKYRFGDDEGPAWLKKNFNVSGITHDNQANGIDTDDKTIVLWDVECVTILECLDGDELEYEPFSPS